MAGNGDREFNRLGDDEVEDSSSDQSRSKMSRQIMMKEKLTVHQVEGEVMECPSDSEEASVVMQTVADGFKRHIVSINRRKSHKEAYIQRWVRYLSCEQAYLHPKYQPKQKARERKSTSQECYQ